MNTLAKVGTVATIAMAVMTIGVAIYSKKLERDYAKSLTPEQKEANLARQQDFLAFLEKRKAR